MKKLIKIALVAMVGVSANFVSAEELTAADGSIYTNLCMVASTGNRAAMYNEIKASGKSNDFIIENLQCNGMDLLSFVESHGRNADTLRRTFDRRSQEVSITDLAMVETEKN